MIIQSQDRIRAAVECVVKVDDEEIQSLYPYLREVQVQMTRKSAAVCTLTFDSFRLENGEWIVQDSGLLAPWKRIQIQAVFAGDPQEVMRGYIKNVSCKYPQDMSATSVVVTGQDESLKLDRGHVCKVWAAESPPGEQGQNYVSAGNTEEMTDGDIAITIAKEAHLQYEVEPGLKNKTINQDDTPIRFLRKRAAINNYELYVREKTLHFHAPALNGDTQPTIMVYAGPATNCLEFNVDNDGYRPEQVVVSRAPEIGVETEPYTLTPDLSRLGDTPAKSDNMGLEPFKWKMRFSAGVSQAEITARAQAKANENSWKIKAEGELDGALYGHVLLNYELVEVDGAGSTNDGKYYVDEVTHIFSSEGYRQRFKLIRNATGA